MRKYENFCNALSNMKDIYNYEEPYDNVVITGLVGLYEICFEQSWKMMKEILEIHGYAEGATGSPKIILKTAYKAGMIRDEEQWLRALQARKAICKGNTLTMYASFNTSKNGILNSQNKKAYIKYGKHTFKLTSKTKYYFSGGEAPNDYCSKSAFMSTMRSMNGLGLRIKVTNGKVVEMSFNS